MVAGPHVAQPGATPPACGLVRHRVLVEEERPSKTRVLSKLVNIPAGPQPPTASRTDVEALSNLVNRATRRSTSKSTSSATWKRKIASTSGVGQTRRSRHSASAGRDSTASARGTGSSVPPSEYWRFQPFSATRSRTACQSSTEASGTRTSGSDPIKSGWKKHLTSSHSRSGTPPCCPGSPTRRTPVSLTKGTGPPRRRGGHQADVAEDLTARSAPAPAERTRRAASRCPLGYGGTAVTPARSRPPPGRGGRGTGH
ncbi:hypothetical protein SMCF_119 [Streptomyces coelicoflavus ZG0656]|nr:hypothetical protein SMCF_119 [Streptomyces coelicoflavus ZG0656]